MKKKMNAIRFHKRLNFITRVKIWVRTLFWEIWEWKKSNAKEHKEWKNKEKEEERWNTKKKWRKKNNKWKNNLTLEKWKSKKNPNPENHQRKTKRNLPKHHHPNSPLNKLSVCRILMEVGKIKNWWVWATIQIKSRTSWTPSTPTLSLLS